MAFLSFIMAIFSRWLDEPTVHRELDGYLVREVEGRCGDRCQ